MIKDVTLKLIQEYFEVGKLGDLHEDFNGLEINLPLFNLFRHVTNTSYKISVNPPHIIEKLQKINKRHIHERGVDFDSCYKACKHIINVNGELDYDFYRMLFRFGKTFESYKRDCRNLPKTEIRGKLKNLSAKLLNRYKELSERYGMGELEDFELTLDFEYKTKPEDIESISVFGSVLYKYFPKEKKIDLTRKKYWLFGPRIYVRTIKKPRDPPNDFDVMVIRKISTPEVEKIIMPIGHTQYTGDLYGHFPNSFYVIDYAPVSPASMKLHITYRSVEQFLTGIGHGDELSESVVKYGVPIIGQKRFEEIIRDVKFLKREPLHQVEWSEGFGKLECKII